MVEKEAQYLADESGIYVPYIPHLTRHQLIKWVVETTARFELVPEETLKSLQKIQNTA